MAEDAGYSHKRDAGDDGGQHCYDEGPSRARENSLSFLAEPVTYEFHRRRHKLMVEADKSVPSFSLIACILGSDFEVAQSCKRQPTLRVFPHPYDNGWHCVIIRTGDDLLNCFRGWPRERVFLFGQEAPKAR